MTNERARWESQMKATSFLVILALIFCLPAAAYAGYGACTSAANNAVRQCLNQCQANGGDPACIQECIAIYNQNQNVCQQLLVECIAKADNVHKACVNECNSHQRNPNYCIVQCQAEYNQSVSDCNN